MNKLENTLRNKLLGKVSIETQTRVELKMRGNVWQKVWHPIHTILAQVTDVVLRDALPSKK